MAGKTLPIILVQDDEEAMREIMAAMLQSAGYECLTAETSAETLAILAGRRVDVVVSGYWGWSEKDFKHMTTTFDVPVIICTATHNRSMIENHLRSTAFDHLFKPFERERLFDIVRRVLEHRRLTLEGKQ